MTATPPIVLTTDFGLADAFVGVMKGVILNINPQAVIIDLTHEIQPQDLRQASFVLGTNYSYFPSNTIHVAVIDPGVGTQRRALLLVTPTARFLAPDNGLLSHVIKGYLAAPAVPPAAPFAPEIPEAPGQPVRIPVPPGLAAYELTNPRYWLHPVSNTFHGRDVFAPSAAYLALGVPAQTLGTPVADLVYQPAPEPFFQGDAVKGTVRGEVIYTDRFGNLITNIPTDSLPDKPVAVEIGRHRISGLSLTFHGSKSGFSPAPVALIGSNGYLEIAVRDDNASRVLGLGLGEPVRVVFGDEPA
jgi:S-adenosylmethionine hydrolase